MGRIGAQPQSSQSGLICRRLVVWNVSWSWYGSKLRLIWQWFVSSWSLGAGRVLTSLGWLCCCQGLLVLG